MIRMNGHNAQDYTGSSVFQREYNIGCKHTVTLQNSNMIYRQGNLDDLEQLRLLAVKAWGQFKDELTTDNWQKLSGNLSSKDTYIELLNNSYCLVCETTGKEIIGMAFLVPNGHPTEIYDEKWSYIRFVSVDPNFGGQGIGRQLTVKCIEIAKSNNEQTIALHTSEMMNTARHIYESLGFKVLKEIEPRLGKKYWIYTLDIA